MTSLKTLIGLDFAAQTGELSVNDVCISPAIGPNIWPARNGVDCDRSFFANTPLAITPGPFQLSSLRSQLRGEGKEEESFFVSVLSFLARSLVPLFRRFPPVSHTTERSMEKCQFHFALRESVFVPICDRGFRLEKLNYALTARSLNGTT